MVTFLNILLISTLLVIGIALWQSWQIIKRGKDSEKPNEQDVIALERRLNVLHVCVYILVVILVFRFCLPYISK
jgi:uncharacterized membrane protein